MLTVYSRGPSFTDPVGKVKFCAWMAALTSLALSPFERRAEGSRSTMICRGLPP
jgi:hypothetical protein